MKITYKFYQRTDSDKNKSYPIYLQIMLNRKTTKRAIGYSCKESECKSETRMLKIFIATTDQF